MAKMNRQWTDTRQNGRQTIDNRLDNSRGIGRQ